MMTGTATKRRSDGATKGKPAPLATERPRRKPIINQGWTAGGWMNELLRKATVCEEMHPELAANYRAWALEIEEYLRAQQSG